MQTKNAPWGILWDPSNIKSIDIIDPAIYFETTTIYSKLPINIIAAETYAGTPDQSGEEKNTTLESLSITGVKLTKGISPLSTKTSMTLPDIAINNLGNDGDGMSQADVVQAVLTEVVNQSMEAALHS
ncbi:hypothetical protein [Sneathiella litorea]|uniref:Uncharacterized protein n=1 Tax=Sneathiella litorea TaxID=2606216 RepID=A0A6L8W367_9PROT|nr:hypothetical protein [Sneathiella litorea]MZR29129.1 hypothetical protein [Sneathiella litorea]